MLNPFLSPVDQLEQSVNRAGFMILLFSNRDEANRFILNRTRDGFGVPGREICLPIDLSRLTALAWEVIRDLPLAQKISRQDVEDVIWYKRDLVWLAEKAQIEKFRKLPN